ncbi:MAG: hypothetical protein ABIQ02_08560, partial [Saprospiraceae bacterium]
MNGSKYIRLFSILFVLISSIHLVGAQIRPGIKFGLTTPDISPKDLVVTNGHGVQYYRISVANARYGIQAGAFVQMQLGGFFVQPEILYNSSSID